MNRYVRRLAIRSLQTAALTLALALSGSAPLHALEQVASFGSNPGNLVMYQHLPAVAATPMPLVLVLHGCTQTATAYADGTGWTALADQLGIALAVAEQQTGNNSSRCFNWFEAGDIDRGAGEALSLYQMVTYLQAHASIDQSRIFVTGLSAGGAMTAVMLSTYPDLFAAGAVMAGLPYRCGVGMSAAFACMNNATSRSAGAWGDLVRAASSFAGPWPRISIWHGTTDTTVVPANADQLVLQWTDVHGLPATPSSTSVSGRDTLRRYDHGNGQTLVEQHLISNMGHGTPVDPGTGSAQCGTAGAYLLDVDICSTQAAARFFGLLGSAPVDGGAVADAGDRDGAIAQDSGGPMSALGETFSDLDRSGDGLDLTGWTLAGFDVVANDRQGNAGSGAGHGHAVSGYSCQAGTVTQTMSRTFALGPQPQLSYWRKLELRATPNINSTATFQVRVNGSVADEQAVTFGQHIDDDWSQHRLDLSAHANSSVTIQFEVAATGTVCIEIVADALLDDIRIEELASDGGSGGPDSAGHDATAIDRSAADRPDTGTAGDATGPADGGGNGVDARDGGAHDAGCGCSMGTAGAGTGWLALVALALGRRRRGATAQAAPTG